MSSRGSLLFELLIAVAIFFVGLSGILFAYGSMETQKVNAGLHLKANRLAENELQRAYWSLKENFFIRQIESRYNDFFHGHISISSENDASRMIKSSISYNSFGQDREVSFQRRITDPSLALGKSTCSDSFLSLDIQGLNEHVIDGISLGIGNIPTDIDAVGNYLFVSADSATTTDPDLFIFDFHDLLHPILLSSLNTGPGLSAIQVVANAVYAGNQSINSQLEVIDATDLRHPILSAAIKLPGTYNENTVIGKRVLYEHGKLFLGTEKSNVNELHIFDAADLFRPVWKSSYEFGAGINSLMSKHLNDHDLLYVALPTDPELRVLDVTDILNPLQVDYFDAPAGGGNGKSLDRLENLVVLGRTIGNKELYALEDVGGLQQKASVAVAASVDDLILRDSYIFAITSKNDDPFRIYQIGTSSIAIASNKKYPIASRAVALDCHYKNFFLLTADPLHPLVLISAI